MSQTFCSLLLFFTSSSWTLLSFQEPLDPGAGTLASGVLWFAFGTGFISAASSGLHAAISSADIKWTPSEHTHHFTRCSQNPIREVIEMEMWPCSSSVAGMPLNVLLSAEVWKCFCCLGDVISVWDLCFTWYEGCVWKWSSCLLKESNGVICTLGSCRWRVWFTLMFLQLITLPP